MSSFKFNTSVACNQVQHEQQNMNGATFPLMRLPFEIRQEILRYACGETTRPHTVEIGSSGQKTVVLGSKKHNATRFAARSLAKLESIAEIFESDLEIIDSIPCPNYAIFQVSKIIRNEALSAGWAGTTKQFTKVGTFLDVAASSAVPPPVLNWLSRIRLTLDLPSLFTFFGLSLSNEGILEYDPESAPSRLFPQKWIPHLKTLEVEFPDPYAEDILTPWTDLMWIHSDDEQWQQDFAWMRKYPCWKTMMDWMLTFAYPNLEGVPSVRLEGCIKTSTKRRWETILSERRRAYKTVEYDHETTLKSILSTPATALPPMCECPQSCDAGENDFGAFTFDHDDACHPREQQTAETDEW